MVALTKTARLVVEEAAQSPPQGEWTYQDYVRLPDDGWRYKLSTGGY